MGRRKGWGGWGLGGGEEGKNRGGKGWGDGKEEGEKRKEGGTEGYPVLQTLEYPGMWGSIHSPEAT